MHMTSVLDLLKNFPESAQNDDGNVMADINYIRKSANLVNDALQKGLDIMQMPNGDIMLTETKTIMHQFTWNPQKFRFERVTAAGHKNRRRQQSDVAKVEKKDDFFNQNRKKELEIST